MTLKTASILEKQKCYGTFYNSWWIAAKCRNMWTLSTSTPQKFNEVESSPSTSTSPHPHYYFDCVYMRINSFYNCVHPFCISTSSIEFVTKQNSIGCLWFLCSLSFVQIFHPTKAIETFYKSDYHKLWAFHKSISWVVIFCELQWWA